MSAISWTPNAKEVETLRAVASALNETSWAASDNTPKVVFDEFVLPSIRDLLADKRQFIDIVCYDIETGEDETSDAHRAKIDELRRNLTRALSIHPIPLKVQGTNDILPGNEQQRA